jgi:hypothetical protein
MDQHEEFGEKAPRIRRGRVDSLSLYEVTESELDLLENGSPASNYLNFAIALLSVGISFMTTIFSATFESDRVFYVFVIVATVSTIIGLILMRLWWSSAESVGAVVKHIRSRLKDDDGDSAEGPVS